MTEILSYLVFAQIKNVKNKVAIQTAAISFWNFVIPVKIDSDQWDHKRNNLNAPSRPITELAK